MIITLTISGNAMPISTESILYTYVDGGGVFYAVLAYYEQYAQTVAIAEDPTSFGPTLPGTWVELPHATYSYLLVNSERVQRLEDLTTETGVYFKLSQVYNASVTADDTIANVIVAIDAASVPSGAVPTTRTITIDGVTYDLSADRTWTTSGGSFDANKTLAYINSQ